MAESVNWLGGVEEALAAARQQRTIALVDYVKPG